tara:strand:- start:2144 stop:3361 length:1218 start_codon:yes stop_codon:yes gene_type:complete
MNPIVKFVAKQLFGQKGAIANRKAVDFSVAKLVERLTNFGVDPRSIKDEKQLIQILNSVKKMEDQAFEQQFGDMLKKSKIKKSAEVVDLQGKKIPNPETNIMGGQAFETEAEIAERIAKDNKKGIANIRKKQKMLADAIDDASPGFANDIKVDAELVAENLAERMGKVYDDLPTKERLDLYDEAYTGLSKQRFKNMPKPEPEDKADGGRIGFKKGMDRRTFMKLMGGITALPVIGKYFKGAETMAPVAEKAVEAAKTVPPYFFDLVNKIKIFGKQRQTPSYKERVNEYTYQGKNGIEYELVEDLDTGEIKITKDKIGGANYGDESYDVIEDRTEMVYKKGQADETTKGTPADEYEEYKVEFDRDGTAADATDVDEVSKMEIIKEVSGDAPAIKKADGGIAMMLGQ